ncbi:MULTISPECIES: hypothetical protein [unclassified Nocardioides]|uniref:hypothetical protein n=1 Tax=unclassified Nocardioides TaxID=2615069 RepID=UPI0006F8A79C|nr:MULTISPECIES: hypothetical protein [unclassified Nocardioides]KRA29705.1 hypothetical protein ASD81_22420 [Nocardioides sp. Root614]KRA88119.1 hypothetical protein ASD84_19195 [Nocardioides sp. Root682]
MNRRALAALAAVTVALSLGGCSEEAPADSDRIVLSPPSEGAGGADHTHAPGQEHAAAAPVGDGTVASAGGYSLTAVQVPAVGKPGDVSFRILDESGTAVTKYVPEQTKLLHLYVVRSDLSEFRHLHPELGEDGTWRARADLGAAGSWRVVAEFTPEGASQPFVLGTTVDVPGAWERVAVPQGEDATVSDDGVVRVRLLGAGTVSKNGRLRLAVTNLDDQPLTLGTFLGASAHLTGFALESRGFVHVHPYGAPEVTDDGTVLTFHTTFTEPGDYRFFVQVRVDGLLHQVAVTATVAPAP